MEATPTRVANKDELRSSYNQMMSLEGDPTEKAKMDKMMEKLAGITLDSADSNSKNASPTPETKTELKSSDKTEEDRKLIANDPIRQMENANNEDRSLETTLPPTDFSPSPSPSDPGRKLNTGMMDGAMGGDIGGGEMDMASMKNSFDNLHSEAPGTGTLDMDSGSDSFEGMDSGMHSAATNAMINRFDQTNQERMAKLNHMFPQVTDVVSKHPKKKAHVISIKKMLKNYPPGLVDEFMPELKEKVMHKFNQMRKTKNENRRIRRLKKKLLRQKKRERQRRKLRIKRKHQREKRRRRKRKLRERRRHHHHHHFRPHFTMKINKKQKMHHQFHTLNVLNKYMHHRGNQLYHAHRRHHHHRERRLEENQSEQSKDPFVALEEDVLNNQDTTESNPNSQGKNKNLIIFRQQSRFGESFE